MNNDEEVLPEEVQSNILFLESKNIWHILSSNPKVVSCKDAATNRNRLGNRGIPIFDELKSELGFFIDKENKKQKVLVHCRGNQKLDRLKISGVLNSEYQRITSSKGVKGLINPFGEQFRNLLQIFDISTTKRFHPPYTMMTNAGDFEYALEFEVNSLIDSLEKTQIEDIIRVDNYNNYIRHKIGILTGNGPDSGILLWKKVNESVEEKLGDRFFKGDLSYPEIIVASIPDMGLSMELDKRGNATENMVIKSTVDLCKNGITLMCIACNTTQYFKDKIENICKLYSVRFISIPDVITDYLKKNQVGLFDFFGISHVVDLENLSAFKDLYEQYTIPELSVDVINKISDMAFAVKGKKLNKARGSLINLIKNNTQHDTIIVALTEISMILSEYKDIIRNKIVVDSLQLLANQVATVYVEGILDTLYIDRDKDLLSFEVLEDDVAKKEAEQGLRNIIFEIDYEFVPPLSYRKSTTSSFGTEMIDHNRPEEYLAGVLDQEIIVSRKKYDNQIIGFVSYKPNHIIKTKEEKSIICYYVTTIGVTKGSRGHGISNQFYKNIEEIVKGQTESKFVATRTWSTNKTHIRILKNLGYENVLTIENDRGNGIHTVYFAKKIIS